MEIEVDSEVDREVRLGVEEVEVRLVILVACEESMAKAYQGGFGDRGGRGGAPRGRGAPRGGGRGGRGGGRGGSKFGAKGGAKTIIVC